VNSKLDACTVIIHWVGYDEDSTHTHHIYWPRQHKVSVKWDVHFTAGTTTISIPSALPTPSAPALTALAPSIPTQAASAPQQPPAATLSREEEIEVEDKLSDLPPLLVTWSRSVLQPPGMPKKSRTGQTAQPMHQSLHVCKPSQYVRKLTSREGTADRQTQSLLGWHPDYDDDSSALTEMLIEIDKEPQEPAEAAYLADIKQAIAAAIQKVKGDPKSLCKTQSRSDWPCWKDAIDREIDVLEQAGTWETVPCLKDKNVVRCKWVCRTKYKADGSIEKYKACVVTHSFSQVYGIDYLETYLPIAKLMSFHTILALAV
jgi:hypothetical protein